MASAPAASIAAGRARPRGSAGRPSAARRTRPTAASGRRSRHPVRPPARAVARCRSPGSRRPPRPERETLLVQLLELGHPGTGAEAAGHEVARRRAESRCPIGIAQQPADGVCDRCRVCRAEPARPSSRRSPPRCFLPPPSPPRDAPRPWPPSARSTCLRRATAARRRPSPRGTDARPPPSRRIARCPPRRATGPAAAGCRARGRRRR